VGESNVISSDFMMGISLLSFESNFGSWLTYHWLYGAGAASLAKFRQWLQTCLPVMWLCLLFNCSLVLFCYKLYWKFQCSC